MEGMLLLPLLPVRAEASERSEQVTQLLFGERFDLLERSDGWSHIRNRADGYVGWVTTKMIVPVSPGLSEALDRTPSFLLKAPVTILQCAEGRCLHLPAASRLWLNDGQSGHFLAKGEWHALSGVTVESGPTTEPSAQGLLETALSFLNAPYLWGGKSIFGMDCSGLVQVSALLNGMALPRDARPQSTMGRPVHFEDARPGDLAFFANAEGRVVHVGLVMGQGFILHASGSVRIDRLDHTGIYNEALGEHTHSWHSLRRIFL